ncbi:universal stress protein [Crocinitomix algicola]|uniref:universal stress protein n=1 Tax=Crocinitomix algicola TaxID=1740263 RepID=UPI000872DD8A|nr:universal stress protein [Crocinitomix algicola]
MNALVLLKHGNLDHSVVNFVSSLFNTTNTAIHLLNIVSTTGEIPTQMNGEVLKNCTEFDLNHYYKRAEENKVYLQNFKHNSIKAKVVLIGNRRNIIKNYIDKNNIDIVVSGAHRTTLMEDVFSTTFASDILNHVKQPFLTIKCNRDNFSPKRIALVGEFLQAEKEDIQTLKEIAAAHHSEFVLTKILTPTEKRKHEDILAVMKKYAQLNDLQPVFRIIESSDKEAGIKSIQEEHQTDLITIARAHESAFSSFIGGSEINNIVNHIYAPILIY